MEALQKKLIKKNIKRISNGVGISFLISYIVVRVISNVATRVIPQNLLYNEGMSWILQIVLSTIMFVGVFSVTAPLMSVKISRDISFKKPKGKISAPLIMAAVGMSLAANVLGGILSSYLTFLGLKDTESLLSSDPNISILLTVISVFASAFLPALVEEFAVHGVVLSSLRRFGDRFAIIIASLMFAVMHGTVEQIPFAFLGSIASCYAIIKCESIWVGVIAHFINNFIACVMDFANAYSENLALVLNITLFCLALLFGILGAYLADKYDAFKLSPDVVDSISIKEKIITFIKAPTVIIFFIYIIIEMVANTILANMG